MQEQLKIFGLSGSLRAASYNSGALRAAGELMPAGMALQIGSFAQVPIYSADRQAEGWPESVLELGERIRRADGLVIASPEYNFSIPGGLKNAIDWVSRLPDQPFRNKPVALLGAATGPVGTARMQYDLRRVMHFLEASVLLKPEIFIGMAAGKFDAEGSLTDPVTRDFLAAQMLAFRGWIARSKILDEASQA